VKKMKQIKCPICNGTLKNGTIKEHMSGVFLGEFPAKICTKCGESFTDENTTEKIALVAKQKGLWNLGHKTKISRSGNSLAVRIPKEIVDFLKLREGSDAYIRPEKDKIIIESI
jgi:YgiT-type zinc finger domain-containing protein